MASTKSLCIWLSWRLLCSAVLSNGYKHVRTADVDLFFVFHAFFSELRAKHLKTSILPWVWGGWGAWVGGRMGVVDVGGR